MLLFNIGGKNRYWMSARTKHAYVWQRGRFEGDIQFWRERLGAEARIDPVADGRAVRIFLESTSQFDGFWKAINQEVPSKDFIHEPPGGSDPDETLDEEAHAA
jgi:hypothetical protein